MTAHASRSIVDAVAKRYRGASPAKWSRKRVKHARPHEILGLVATWEEGDLHLRDGSGATVLAAAQTATPDTRALHDHIDRWTAATGPFAAAGHTVRETGRALLHDAGIDPDRAHALAGVLGEAKWLIGSHFAAVDHAQGVLRSMRQLTDRIFWIDGQLTIIGHSLPATMRNAYVGETLSALVSHPVLDGFDLVVRDIDSICPTGSASGVSMVVRVDCP